MPESSAVVIAGIFIGAGVNDCGTEGREATAGTSLPDPSDNSKSSSSDASDSSSSLGSASSSLRSSEDFLRVIQRFCSFCSL